MGAKMSEEVQAKEIDFKRMKVKHQKKQLQAAIRLVIFMIDPKLRERPAICWAIQTFAEKPVNSY